MIAFAAALTLTLSAALADGAMASSKEVTKITEECSNGTLPTGFSQQAYSQATRELEPFLAEYSDCPDLIHKAQLAGAAGARGGAGGGSGATGAAAVAPPTPVEQHALETIPHAAAPSVAVGGQLVHPGVVRVDLASAFSTLPTSLLVLLAFLLACTALAIAWAGHGALGRLRAGRNGGGPSAGE